MEIKGTIQQKGRYKYVLLVGSDPTINWEQSREVDMDPWFLKLRIWLAKRVIKKEWKNLQGIRLEKHKSEHLELVASK